MKAAKTRVIESPPKELLVDLDADSQPPPPPSAAKVVRPERPQRVTSTAVKVSYIFAFLPVAKPRRSMGHSDNV